MSLGFADAIFRKERSDDRKCVCCSQAKWIPIVRLVTLFRRRKKQSINLETKLLIARRSRLIDLRMYFIVNRLIFGYNLKSFYYLYTVMLYVFFDFQPKI